MATPTVNPSPPKGPGETRSVGEIVADVTNDLTTLIRKEMDLAKTEMKQEFTKAGKGAGLLGGAGLAGYFTLLFLSFTLIFLLDNWMPVEFAAFILTLAWGAGAAILTIIGKKELDHANPQLPKTQSQVKDDIQWTKAHTS